MATATMTRMNADCDGAVPWCDGPWNPWVTRKAIRENQKRTLRTTAEPIPWVPRAKPASCPGTPDWVSSR